ncbi:MAG: iron ABC transporter permease [Deltaproteobacteria bacterium]|nr:iron ABC transporter permease [Deltaproteobacteria bacterium]MBW2345912.1 iron ABC transporter permease [Deltaproteobacteria bacterium]
MLKKQGFGATRGLQTLCFISLLLACIILSTGMGYIEISPLQVIKVVISRITGTSDLLQGMDSVFPYVIMDVRLPRILTSAIVGAGLSVAGVIFQGILLNPLADPYTLGISAGAAFGASIALLLDVMFIGCYTVPLFAFIGAVLTLLAVMFISSSGGQTSSNNLILSGIIVAAILSAGISFIKYVADEQVSIIIFWLMGSFGSKSWTDVFLILLFVLTGFVICLFFARDLNIMTLGDRSAGSLGIETNRLRIVLLVTASLITAGCVSVSGIIGFVGLVIPHLMRFFVGPDNRKLLPASALVGAILLLCADTITRAVLPTEIPIGVLTALIGGPFFCYIFRKRRILKTYG